MSPDAKRSVTRGFTSLAATVTAAMLLAACGSTQHALTSTQTGRQSAKSTPSAVSHPSGGRDNPSQLAGDRLWVNPNSPAARQADAWRSQGRLADATLIGRIAAQPTAVWLAGGKGTVRQAAGIVANAERTHSVAQLVLYDIPDRDCGQYSAGGAATPSAYLSWVRAVSSALGSHPVIVILEPDAIDQAASGCLGSARASQRYATLTAATKLLRHDRNAHIYLDAGDAGWLEPRQILRSLELSGIAHDSGFSLNVANFFTTAESIAYGRQLSTLLKGKHFVIDTSRNGNGAPNAAAGVSRWCNPAGRSLGQTPTTDPGQPLVDALLWVKYPGQSDGDCKPGQPPAGVWWPQYALRLARNTGG